MILGDIVGSLYEYRDFHRKKFPFLTEKNHYTDDTVMAVAIAKALVECKEKGNFYYQCNYWMRRLGLQYPKAGYGRKFAQWLQSEDAKPYGSLGNGSAMRVTPIAYAFDTLEEVEFFASIQSRATHNSKEAIDGSKAMGASVFLARQGQSKEDIQHYVEKTYSYDFSQSIRRLKHKIDKTHLAIDTVPVALQCFFQSKSLEDAIRNAVSIGGDTDTTAAMAGGVAGAFYGVEEEWILKIKSYMDPSLWSIIQEFKEAYNGF
ncbi:MAG: ADP-ribosylglycohydrolase family protein [Tissierellia bacterium]|nr:ADP-ribosylglycohydrolase family protein [Tissierellia bacterium]